MCRYSMQCPLLLAAGGGGGIGIHICRSIDEVRANFQSAARQGQAAFGDAGVFVEKYVQVGAGCWQHTPGMCCH